MKTLRVNLKGRAYDIVVGSDLLRQSGDMIRRLGLGRRLGLVTHPALAEVHGYAPCVISSLRDAGHEVYLATVPPGEESKSLDQAARLRRELVRAGLDRGSGILALGGGVVGDLAGFVAATLFRSIAFVNLPTTLLAQVDRIHVSHPSGFYGLRRHNKNGHGLAMSIFVSGEIDFIL